MHEQESRHKVPKSVSRAVLGRMQSTLHATRRTPHGASRLVQAMSAWLMKTRRAPSRHSRDARVYGHTTAAMHKPRYPPPPPSVRVRVRVTGSKPAELIVLSLSTSPTPSVQRKLHHASWQVHRTLPFLVSVRNFQLADSCFICHDRVGAGCDAPNLIFDPFSRVLRKGYRPSHLT